MNRIQKIAIIGGIIVAGISSVVSTYGSHRPDEIDPPTSPRLSSLAPNSPSGGTHQHYIPQVYDVTNTLIAESRCCFFTGRWILQPINIVSPIIASALIGFGEYYIDNNPSTARLLNGIGLGFSILDFISGVLLVKVDNKLQGIDEVVQYRRGAEG